ncbi:SCP160 protein [Pluteus cervinus]|uniref:SCP160 protein n=1 Tax=Pluteus cervinus TaxID=181527 RepID=A0ACD3B8M7_9AGAR|nr:SCP160 protein [Pluteus cervinus]
MTLTAADLQRRHELEGAPDPFPSLAAAADPVPVKARAPFKQDLDTDSQSAFPSLVATSGPPVQAPSAWGTAGPRIRATASKTTVVTDTFTLSANELPQVNKDGKPVAVGEVLKQVMAKYKVKIEASTNQRSRQTTFHIKSESRKDLDKAKRSLVALLSPVVSLIVNAPASTIASIIGPKGATLKQIRDQTTVRIDIPRKDAPAAVNGQANGHVSGKASPSLDEDEEDEPTVPVTVTGPQPLALEAQAMLNHIISSKTSTTTKRIRQIPPHVLPFILTRRTAYLEAAQSSDVQLTQNQGEITVSGDRGAVGRIVEAIKNDIEKYTSSLTSLKISLPKLQHRLLTGSGVSEILLKSRCSVVIAGPEDPSDEVTVWGLGVDLPNGLAAVMERANSQHIHEFPIPGPIATSRQLLTYLAHINYASKLQHEVPGVLVFLPSLAAARKASKLTIDLVGEKQLVDAVVRQVSALIGKLIGATREVSIDWLLHRIVSGKNAKKLKAFHDHQNVQVFFPSEADEWSHVLLVYDPLSPNASFSPDKKKEELDGIEKELQKMAKDAADVKSQTIVVEKRWHDSIVGQNGTTLNAIIGEDKALSIKFGPDVADAASEDTILVRGASKDVDRAVQEILKIVENAQNDEIDNSHSTEFDVEREFVGRIVGAQGSGINKLRDQLGVKVDVSDEDDKEKEGGKRKKGLQLKSRVKITGRKENVEEAKKRILAQVDRLADETSETLKIPSQYHSSLIGQNGKYAIRLEEKYGVKITFPRRDGDGEAKTREQIKSDEVLIKGGRKGVAGAKSELLDAVDFEKESNHTVIFKVVTRAIPRILGKGGASINEIKDNTGAQIDVEKATDDSPTTTITARGTKEAIADAKAAILAIADSVSEEINASVNVDSKFHRNLIGAGGQGLRDLIIRCGGPTDSKAQAGLVRFPRPGDPGDEVRLRGEPKLVKRLHAELEKIVADLRDRVVLGVEIPAAQHRALIGRGGHHLNEFQQRLNVQVQFPGSRSYSQVGEAENAGDFADIDAANIVKISGARAACESAVEDLKSQIKPPTPEAVSTTIEVPVKFYHAISQQGQFFRSLRSHGVQVDHPDPPPATVPSRPEVAPTARIDEPDTQPEVQWDVAPNYQDGGDQSSAVWTLKARDQAGLDYAQSAVEDAIKHAERMSHVGLLTLPDRSSFPRIVGTKGANVARLRNETGADITVSREDNTITIIGTESDINAAKDAIVRIATTSPRGPRRNHD